MTNNINPDRYAVMGNPIAHSKSPLIHAQFAEQTGQPLRYDAILVPLHGFNAAVAAFRIEGGRGLNVTVPFKQEAWLLAQHRTPRAERAGAVNTLWWDAHNTLHGDTTDGIGLVRDLRDNHGLTLNNQRILLLGAGGAVRGVIESLLAENPAALVIANRTAHKAVELANAFQSLGSVSGYGFDALPAATTAAPYDLIINGTAAGLTGEVPPLPATAIGADTWAYDMMYAPEPTAFVRWALEKGARQACDGLGMLVEQAAEAFWIWRGVRPTTARVIARLRAG
ncbi:MAG: shikimate dehydrogenase [Gammaproteobacteria bacterium]|nr:shikimate dehydrogenase [Gammaproteobacteria bacterium]